MLKPRECLSATILAIAMICFMPSGQTAAGAAGGVPTAPATVDKRLPVPTAAQQAADEQTLEQLFSQKYRVANANNIRQFANYLWNTYSQAQSRPVMHFVAMKMLGRLAGKLGMASYAYDAADALAQGYRISQSRIYIETGGMLLQGRYFPVYVYQLVHDRSVTQEKQAFSAGDYKNAEALIHMAARAAIILHNKQQIVIAEAELRRLQRRLILARQAEIDMAALKVNPNDRKLQLRVGLYLWLSKGHTKKGLALVVASAAAGAAELAKLQTEGPPDLYAWLRYYHLLVELGKDTGSKPYAELATRHAVALFSNRTATVRWAFDRYLRVSYPRAEAFMSLAIADTQGTGSRSLQEMAIGWRRLASDGAALHQHFGAAMHQIEANPKSPKANRAVGEYLCLIKGQWEIGSDYLMRSGDHKLIAANQADAAARAAQARYVAAKTATQAAAASLQNARSTLRQAQAQGKKRNLPRLVASVASAKGSLDQAAAALASAQAAAIGHYKDAGDAWWGFSKGCRGLLQNRMQARAVHWYMRAYKPISKAPTVIRYRVKRFNGQKNDS